MVLQLERLSEFTTQKFKKKSFTAVTSLPRCFFSVWSSMAQRPNFQIGKFSNWPATPVYFMKINSFHRSRSSEHRAKARVPQGTILCHLLFISCCNMPNSSALAIYTMQDKNLDKAITNLQTLGTIKVNWFIKWDIHLNTIKVKTKIFTIKEWLLCAQIVMHEP